MGCTIYELLFEENLTWVVETIIFRERICVTGDVQVTITENYRVSLTVVTRIIKETRKTIWDAL